MGRVKERLTKDDNGRKVNVVNYVEHNAFFRLYFLFSEKA